jgi:hypothetical protein
VHDTVAAAGAACLAAVAAAGDRSPDEVFYACPTLSVPEFFRAAAAAGGGAGRQPGLAGADFDAASQLARAVQVRRFRRLSWSRRLSLVAGCTGVAMPEARPFA